MPPWEFDDSPLPPQPEVNLAYDAHIMNMAGKSWVEIAETLGFPSANAALLGVRAYLQRAVQEEGEWRRAERLYVQLERYRKLLAGVWDKAEKGDVNAVAAALRIMERYERLTKLDVGSTALTSQTILVTATNMAAQMEAMVHEAEAEKAAKALERRTIEVTERD